MSPGVRKVALAVHLTVSVGWAGAVVAYLVLGVTAVKASDDATVRAAWVGMEVTGWFAIVPLAVAALLTGITMALGTPWGLFRHYWVVISLVLTGIAVLVLVVHMPDVSTAAEVARRSSGEELAALGGDLLHPSLGLLVLLVVQVLNVVKPRGLTRYGARRQAQRRVAER